VLTDFFYTFLLIILSIPAAVVVVYLIMAIYTLRTGKREKARFKISGSLWTIVICVGLLLLAYLAWTRLLGNFK
jgi:hypothetical protein